MKLTFTPSVKNGYFLTEKMACRDLDFPRNVSYPYSLSKKKGFSVELELLRETIWLARWIFLKLELESEETKFWMFL